MNAKLSGIFVHESAIVSPHAKIGTGTKIWVNCQIREGAIVGEDCILSKDTYIDTGVTIGSRVKIQNGVSVYHGVVIEDEVFVGPNAVFTNDLVPRATNADWKISETLVKKGASIGANATIICGHVIGQYAMIGAGSVVTKDIPPYGLAIGNPAIIVGRVCRCGARLSKSGYCTKCQEQILNDLEG